MTVPMCVCVCVCVIGSHSLDRDINIASKRELPSKQIKRVETKNDECCSSCPPTHTRERASEQNDASAFTL